MHVWVHSSSKAQSKQECRRWANARVRGAEKWGATRSVERLAKWVKQHRRNQPSFTFGVIVGTAALGYRDVCDLELWYIAKGGPRPAVGRFEVPYMDTVIKYSSRTLARNTCTKEDDFIPPLYHCEVMVNLPSPLSLTYTAVVRWYTVP